MPTFKVTAPDGRVVRLTGDSAPTDQELEGIFANLPQQKEQTNPISLAGPIGRGVEAVQKGIQLGDAPSIMAKMGNSALGGIPEFLANRPIAGPMQTFSPSADVMPKAVTPEGDKLGNEMGLAASFLPSVEILQGLVAPASRKIAAGTANRLMTSVLKPSIKQLQKEPQIGFKAAKMGLSGSKEQIASKAEKLIVENEAKLEKIVNASSGQVDAVKIADNLDSLKRPFANTGDDASVAAIEKLQETLKSKGTLSVKDANQLKKDFYSGLKTNAYGQGTSKLGASVQAEKTAARGLKEGIEQAVPNEPIGAINRKTGVAGMVRDAASRQDLMDQRKNVMGLADMGLSAGTAATGNPVYLGLALARRAMGSDVVKSKLAELLAKYA
jgi:hypothetical protein